MSLSWVESGLDSWEEDGSDGSEEFWGSSVGYMSCPPVGWGAFLGMWGADTIEDSSREQPSS